ERGVVGGPLDNRPEGDPRGNQREPGKPPGHQRTTAAATASPESSFFAMKLHAGFESSRQRSDAMLRLDVRTIAGGTPSLESRSATAKPSRSGRCTSSSTTSGRSVLASSSAEAPSAASPTTSKPAASSSARAADRNAGWSSTISTVLATPETVAEADPH